MQVKSFVERILTSRQRSRQKERIISEILATPQENRGVINLHRIDVQNAGDYYSGPHNYFEELKNSALDIYDYNTRDKETAHKWIEEISKNKLILGGGGLLNRKSFEKQMKMFERLSGKNKKVVLWGAGHNSKNKKDFNRNQAYNIDISKFGLAGTRDYNGAGEWVPCVSCLHPVFDRSYSTNQEVGIVFHKKTLKKDSTTSRFNDFPQTSNTTDIENLVTFIGKSESIITDSYHAMYWSILLNKKVVVVPNSSKFFDFKYAPVISSFDDCLKDLDKAVAFSGVLEECREINYSFANRVFDYLGL